MRWAWNYQDLPVSLEHLLALSALVVLAFWAQSGFVLDVNHALFLGSNYLTWFLLLPSIHQLVSIRGLRMKVVLQKLGMGILLLFLHWILSNGLLSLSKHLLLGQGLLEDYRQLGSFFLPSLVSRGIDLALFTGLLSWLRQQKTITQHRVRDAEQQSQLHQSRLEALKGQLNPHFLFNALHAINAQIGHNNDKAQQLTLQFSQLLRELLAINQKEEHTLKEEMDFMNRYLEVEQERFRDRLIVRSVIDEQALPCIIPTMTLQPIIENAFKHGISQLTQAAELQIHIELQEQRLMIKVVNDCPDQTTKSDRVGIGLHNLEDRLSLYYDQQIRIETERSTNQFSTLLQLPV